MTPAQLQPTSPKMGKKEKRKKDNLSPKGSPDAMTQRRKDAPKLPKNVKSGAGLVIGMLNSSYFILVRCFYHAECYYRMQNVPFDVKSIFKQ